MECFGNVSLNHLEFESCSIARLADLECLKSAYLLFISSNMTLNHVTWSLNVKGCS